MVLGLLAFFSTRIEYMLVVLFLMALHSTIFSPAKYGIVPEMLPDTELSRANALLVVPPERPTIRAGETARAFPIGEGALSVMQLEL